MTSTRQVEFLASHRNPQTDALDTPPSPSRVTSLLPHLPQEPPEHTQCLEGRVSPFQESSLVESPFWVYEDCYHTFTAREEELEQLEQLILKKHAQTTTLSGPEGVGKTALAIAFAKKNLQAFSFVALLDHSSPITQEESYIYLANRLGMILPPLSDNQNDNIKILKETVMDGLEQRAGNWTNPYLLIFENGVDVFFSHGAIQGHAIITTREENSHL